MPAHITCISRKYEKSNAVTLFLSLLAKTTYAGREAYVISWFLGGFRDEPAPEIKYAPYGSDLEMDCRIDLETPIQFHWKKLAGLLPSDTQILEVHKTYIL